MHVVTSTIVRLMSIVLGPAISRIRTLYNINVGSTLATYPFITQCLIILFVLLSFAGLFVDVKQKIGNSYKQTIEHFELIRLFISAFPTFGISGLKLNYIIVEFDKMERALGSSQFLILLGKLQFATCLLFLLYRWMLWVLFDDEEQLKKGMCGYWTLCLAVVALRCCCPKEFDKDADSTNQQVFLQKVAKRAYPIVALLSGEGGELSHANILGVVVGYLFGVIGCWKCDYTTVYYWEVSNGVVRHLITQKGYIAIDDSRVNTREPPQSLCENTSIYNVV